jgi:hypothetical protein
MALDRLLKEVAASVAIQAIDDLSWLRGAAAI